MVEGTDDLIWGVRRVEIYTNRDLKRIAGPIASVENDVCYLLSSSILNMN